MYAHRRPLELAVIAVERETGAELSIRPGSSAPMHKDMCLNKKRSRPQAWRTTGKLKASEDRRSTSTH